MNTLAVNTRPDSIRISRILAPFFFDPILQAGMTSGGLGNTDIGQQVSIA